MAHLVNPYWSRFAPMDPTMSKILGLFTLAILIISCCGNGVVVYIFGGTKSLRTPANLLVLNLAFSDFCMMASQSPVMLVNFYYETWILGPLWCDIYAVCGSMFGCVSIWSMCMIAFDRYNVIVKGINGTPMTIKLAIMKILFIWLMATFWTIMPLIGWSSYVPEGNLTACSIDYMTRQWNPRSYLITYSIFVYYVPLFLICYSYWFIIAVSWSQISYFFSLYLILSVSLKGRCSPREGHARASQKNECKVVAQLRRLRQKCWGKAGQG